MTRPLILAAACIQLFSIDVRAESSAEVDAEYSHQMEYFLKTAPPSLKKSCGDIKFDIDKKSWLKAATLKLAGDEEVYAVERFCGAAMHDVADYCRYGRKDAVMRQLKKIVCIFDKKTKQKLSFKDGTLRIVGGGSSNRNGVKMKWAIGDLLKDGEWTFRQADLIKDQERRVATEFENYKKRCGDVPEWKIEWTTMIPEIDAALKSTATPQLYHQFVYPISSLASVCMEGSETLVAAQIKRYECRFGEDRIYTLKDGTLSFLAPFNDEGLSRFVKVRSGELITNAAGFNHRELQYIDHEEKQLDRVRELFADSCGYEIDAQFDWKSFQPILKPLVDSTTYGVASACKGALRLMADSCTAEKRSKTIKRKVKSFVCAYHKKKKSKSTLSKKKITFRTNLEDKNNDPLRKFLIKKKIVKKAKKMRTMTAAEVRKALYRSPGDRCRSKCISPSKCRRAKGRYKCRQACKARCPK